MLVSGAALFLSIHAGLQQLDRAACAQLDAQRYLRGVLRHKGSELRKCRRVAVMAAMVAVTLAVVSRCFDAGDEVFAVEDEDV
jgi:hypothetical protein